MKPSFPLRIAASTKQRGAVLVVTVVLLLLVTVLSLFALNVGVFEQRSSANDLRAKMVRQVADNALAQGMEFLKLRPELLDQGASWERCPMDEDPPTFPCGVVPPDRRGTMYRWIGGTVDFDGSGTVDLVEKRMLPINAGNLLTAMNDFSVRAGAGAVLCRVRIPTVAGAEAECTTSGADDYSGVNALTVVGQGQVVGETASGTVAQTIGTYKLLNNPPAKPPIVASGTVDIKGTLDVVTNPGAGGTGVAVSVWTRKDVDPNGSPTTCHFDEFIRFGSDKGGAQVTFEPDADGNSTDVIVCDDCYCPRDYALSFPHPGNQSGDCLGSGECKEGLDILDIDGDSGVTRDVRPEEFPCDLFEYLFSVKAWEDTDGDYFCETKIMVDNPAGTPAQIGADELFLTENADVIIDDAAECTQLGPSTSGLVWDRVGCDVDEVGSAEYPVALVVDGDVAYQGIRLFGLLFVRATGTELDPLTGGDASLRFNGQSVIYGSAIIQGEVAKANGTAAVVYNEKVLANFDNDPDNVQFGGVPGSWTDRFTY